MKGGLLLALVPLAVADEKAIARLAVIMARKSYAGTKTICSNEAFVFGETLRDCSEDDPCWAIGDSSTECGECYAISYGDEDPLFVKVKDVTTEDGAKFQLPDFAWQRGCPYACVDDDVCVTDPIACTSKGQVTKYKTRSIVSIRHVDCPIPKRRLESNEGRGKNCSGDGCVGTPIPKSNDLPPLPAEGCVFPPPVCGDNGLPPLPAGGCNC